MGESGDGEARRAKQEDSRVITACRVESADSKSPTTQDKHGVEAAVLGKSAADLVKITHGLLPGTASGGLSALPARKGRRAAAQRENATRVLSNPEIISNFWDSYTLL